MWAALLRKDAGACIRPLQQALDLRSLSGLGAPHWLDNTSSIVGAYTPVTKRLWESRLKWDNEALEAAHPQTTFHPRPPHVMEILYPFSSDPVLREHYRNPWNAVRVGRLMEDMDSLAGVVAYDHCETKDSTARPPLLVTATVEAIRMAPRPLSLHQDAVMLGRVVWTGVSSMDIAIEVHQAAPSREQQQQQQSTERSPAMAALFTFVARDALNGTPQRINPLQPRTAEDKVLFASRQRIADTRKAVRAAEEESGQKWTPEQLHFARELLNQASVKRDLPALAAPDAVLMPQTVLENTFTTQPQQRNIHGRIFGGFLMRRAFELAHSCAYMLSACRPRTVAVDEIRFKKPVDVGDLVRFRARVLWTWHEPEQPDKGMVHVQVQASVVRPEVPCSEETNTFNFLFSVKRTTTDTSSGSRDTNGIRPLARVLPTNENEALASAEYYAPGSVKRQLRLGALTGTAVSGIGPDAE